MNTYLKREPAGMKAPVCSDVEGEPLVTQPIGVEMGEDLGGTLLLRANVVTTYGIGERVREHEEVLLRLVHRAEDVGESLVELGTSVRINEPKNTL